MSVANRAALCLLVIPFSCAASGAGPLSPDDTAAVRTIIDSLYRLRYDKAIAVCRDLASKAPSDPLPDVFTARVLWQRELSRKQALALTRFAARDFFIEGSSTAQRVEPDPEAEREFQAATRQAIDKAKAQVRQNQADLRAWFLMGLAHQNMAAFAVAFRGGWREAFLSGENTRRAHKRVSARYPDFVDSLLSLAVYEYVVANVNWFYRALGAMVGVRGDETRAIATMERAAKESVFAGPDARTMLVLVYTRKKMFQQAADVLAGLRAEYPENCLIPMDEGTLALELRKYTEAAGFYRGLLAASGGPGYDSALCAEPAAILHRLGIAQRSGGDAAAALRTFESALDARGPPKSKTLARLELAKTLDLLGRRPEAVPHFEIVRNSDDVGGSRAAAADCLAKGCSQRP